MLKTFTLICALFFSAFASANTDEVKPVSEKIIFTSSFDLVVAQQVESLASEDLPDAILRLYQLEKVKFTDRMIYTHKPLELANIKNPVKTA
ncbi:MAG: hypothetical protein VYB38_00840 [Bacteroidota bacterium]|nr:hypothetical protein [Bacteroidota bacterium]